MWPLHASLPKDAAHAPTHLHAAQVNAVLEFLRGLGFAERDVVKVSSSDLRMRPLLVHDRQQHVMVINLLVLQAVKVFPQIVGLSVEEQLQANVAKLKKDWKMNDKVIPGIVKRQPQVRECAKASRFHKHPGI